MDQTNIFFASFNAHNIGIHYNSSIFDTPLFMFFVPANMLGGFFDVSTPTFKLEQLSKYLSIKYNMKFRKWKKNKNVEGIDSRIYISL